VDVEVAEQRRGVLDRGAAERLDALLQLLGVGGAGLDVLEGDDVRGDVRGDVGGDVGGGVGGGVLGQGSRL
jgi:hypothetical protein